MLNDKFFLDVASRLAEESHCISLHVGAVIVRDKRIISMGYNGTPEGLPNCDDQLSKGIFKREEHHEWSLINEIHAEMNALIYAAKNGIPVQDCTIYVTHKPCYECMKNISQSGIKRVVYLHDYKYSDISDGCCKYMGISVEHYDPLRTEDNKLKEQLSSLQMMYNANMRQGRGIACQKIAKEIDELLDKLKVEENGTQGLSEN